MMENFLDRILATKRREVEELKQRRTAQHAPSPRETRGFAQQIRSTELLSVVAEIKQASPSKGVIEPDFQPLAVASDYQQAGATCISVLTDAEYFMGSISDLRAVREAVNMPVLRKDFIIDEVQVDEATEAGADAVLLICAALSAHRLQELSDYAHQLGLDTLIEVHSEAELGVALRADPSVVGVNNRNLTTFEVRLETSETLIPMVPKGIPTLAESGIKTRSDAARMAACGADGILVGESLMRMGRGDALQTGLQQLRVARTATRLETNR